MRALHHPKTEEIELVDVLHALADSIRLGIVATIVDGGESSCGAFDFGITKASLSHHFRVLRESGITATRQDGKHRFISLRRTDLERRFPGVLESILTAVASSGGVQEGPR